jgi:alpha-glucosidase
MKKLVLVLSLFFFCYSAAQVTLRITSVPTSTPSNATIYLAGTINNWNAMSASHIMQPDGLGARTIVIPEGVGTVEFKFTRGSWATVEGNASGGFLPNRTFTFTGSPQVINLNVQSWEDISGSGSNSTASSNVQILNPSFFMPQLNRNRKIWIYLPPDYYTTTKTYPVIYMQDGQNLFDNLTSFSGEWQIDETLNSLHAQGNYGAIVVGIDNGGAERLNEYSPWNNVQYGGGQGDLYMQFVGETLKPYIDSNFRTKPQPQFNALLGSSMGAFIATYGGVKYPNLFSKIGIFSPAYWFSLSNMSSYISSTTNNLENLRLYFVAGQNESTTMVPNINTIQSNFSSKGVSSSNIFSKFDSYGTHTEVYWRGEFAAAYLWLFQNENLQNESFTSNQVQIFQNNNSELMVSGLDEETEFAIYSLLGQKIATIKLRNGQNAIDAQCQKGIYFLISQNTTKFHSTKLYFNK